MAVALADGHGSSRRSDIGARIAVEVTVGHLLRFYDALSGDHRDRLATVVEFARSPIRRQIVQAWAEQIAADNPTDPLPLLQYGSTLLFALVAPEFLLLGQLGDGDILLVGQDGQVSRPIPQETLAFANETPSLCQPEAWKAMQVEILPPPAVGSLLLLCTDGYANSYTDTLAFERIGPDYLRLIQEHGFETILGHLPKFLQKVSEGGSGDDVALALVHSGPWSPEP